MQQTNEHVGERRNRWAIPLATLGALAVAAAAIINWAVVPSRKQLPADTNTTRQLTGTADVLLNPAAVASGDLNNAMMTGVPVTADRTVKAIATDGSVAEVTDSRVLKTGTGQELGKSETTYAVDRKSLEAAKDIPSDWKVTPHEGLTVSWPIGAEKKDYPVWINETQSTTPAKFVREEKKGDLDTYVYEVSSAAAPIKDEQILAALPKALPQAALAAIAARLPLPDDAKAALAQALPGLGEPVPLSYTYELKSTYWVEPTTGIVVDTQRDEVRKAALAGPLAAPVYDVNTKFNEQSVTAAVKDATEKRDSIKTASETLPRSLAIPGLVALGAGLLGMMMRRKPQPAPVRTTQRVVNTERPVTTERTDRTTDRPTDRPTTRTDRRIDPTDDDDNLSGTR